MFRLFVRLLPIANVPSSNPSTGLSSVSSIDSTFGFDDRRIVATYTNYDKEAIKIKVCVENEAIQLVKRTTCNW